MTLEEFDLCVTGWNRAQGAGPAPDLPEADYDALCDIMDLWNSEAA